LPSSLTKHVPLAFSCQYMGNLSGIALVAQLAALDIETRAKTLPFPWCPDLIYSFNFWSNFLQFNSKLLLWTRLIILNMYNTYKFRPYKFAKPCSEEPSVSSDPWNCLFDWTSPSFHRSISQNIGTSLLSLLQLFLTILRAKFIFFDFARTFNMCWLTLSLLSNSTPEHLHGTAKLETLSICFCSLFNGFLTKKRLTLSWITLWPCLAFSDNQDALQDKHRCHPPFLIQEWQQNYNLQILDTAYYLLFDLWHL